MIDTEGRQIHVVDHGTPPSVKAEADTDSRGITEYDKFLATTFQKKNTIYARMQNHDPNEYVSCGRKVVSTPYMKNGAAIMQVQKSEHQWFSSGQTFDTNSSNIGSGSRLMLFKFNKEEVQFSIKGDIVTMNHKVEIGKGRVEEYGVYDAWAAIASSTCKNIAIRKDHSGCWNVARISASSVGLVYGSMKLKYLQMSSSTFNGQSKWIDEARE
ncbi:hypothetical protein L6452_32625 [Arctium lappa]|uniref:Uncharacterized protein n=1 Tax=Arctium lappa TaxID=4217 RepID=A0ACB8Z5H7_ARCLA|nr:hypothetical protein L6452_32625 [Arctium lappa]